MTNKHDRKRLAVSAAEDNAAILLIQAGISPNSEEFKKPYIQELKVSNSPGGVTLEPFAVFAAKADASLSV